MLKALRSFLNRITGISTPVFGLSWNPSVSEVETARRLLVFLEDRRVLQNLYEGELPGPCEASIQLIRERLTEELGHVRSRSQLAQSMRIMRKSCLTFLNYAQSIAIDDMQYNGFTERMIKLYGLGYFAALGSLRSEFGVQINTIIKKYDIKINQELAIVLPKNSLTDISVRGTLIILPGDQFYKTKSDTRLKTTFLLAQVIKAQSVMGSWEKFWVLEDVKQIFEPEQIWYGRQGMQVVVRGKVVNDTETQ